MPVDINIETGTPNVIIVDREGPQGPQGEKGDPGEQGIQGEKGDKGDTGEKGDKGDRGLIGPTGLTGATGSKGLKGDKGDRGIIGLTGPTGPQGPAGPAGAKGDTGATGATGATGPAGADGLGLNTNTVIPAHFHTSAIDPATNVAGARTLGTGAQQAAPGDTVAALETTVDGLNIDRVGNWRTTPTSLQRWRAALAKRASEDAIMVIVGDDLIEGEEGRPVDSIREIYSRFNDNITSLGWVNADPDVSAYLPAKYELTTGTANSPAGSNINVQAGLANYSYKLGTGSVLTLNTVPESDRVIFYYTAQKSGAGSLEIRINGSLVQTIDTNDAALGVGVLDSGRSWEWTGTKADITSLTVTAITAPAIFDGSYIANGDKVLIFNAGHTGQDHSDYANDGHHQFLANLDPDLVVDAFGVGESLAGYVAAMETYYDAVIADTSPSPSFVFIGQFGSNSKATIETTIAEAKQKAVDLGAPYIDMYAVFGSIGSDDDPYSIGAGDATHLSADGGVLWAEIFSSSVDDIDPSASGAGGATLEDTITTAITMDQGTNSIVFDTDPYGSTSMKAFADGEASPRFQLTSFLNIPIIQFGPGGSTEPSKSIVFGSDGGVTASNGAYFAVPLARPAVTSKTSSFTLDISHIGQLIEVSGASPVTVTIPKDDTVNFPAGTQITLRQSGSTATISVVGAFLAPISSNGTHTWKDGDEIVLVKKTGNTWYCYAQQPPKLIHKAGLSTATNTTSTTHMTYSIPANVLKTGDVVRWTIHGVINNSTNGRQYSFTPKINGSNFAAVSSVAQPSGESHWLFEANILVTGAATQEYGTITHYQDSSKKAGQSFINNRGSLTVSTTSAITLSHVLSCNSSNAGAIGSQLTTVELIR